MMRGLPATFDAVLRAQQLSGLDRCQIRTDKTLVCPAEVVGDTVGFVVVAGAVGAAGCAEGFAHAGVMPRYFGWEGCRARSVGAFQRHAAAGRQTMTVYDQQRNDSTGADEQDPAGAVVEVQNTAVMATASSVVQAHTITGGVHHHHHHAPPPRPVPRQLQIGRAHV